MYDDDYDYEAAPSEYSTEELEKAIETKTEVIVNSDLAVSYIRKTVENNLKPVLKKIIDAEVENAIRNSYSSKVQLENIIREVIKEKMLEKFPDAVENKVNEFEKLIRESKISDYRNDPVSDIHAKAKARVEKYIQEELVGLVAKSKEEIDTFARNYFTNNLFRAMGMMTQQFNSLPETKG